MRGIVADWNMSNQPPGRAVDDGNPILRRIGVNTAVFVANHEMGTAQSQPRRRAVGLKREKNLFAVPFNGDAITALEHGNLLAHRQLANASAHHRALAAQPQILVP